MKKLIIMIMLILATTGCSINEIKKDDYASLADNLLSKNVKLKNTTGSGYNYYLPPNFNISQKSDVNEILYSNGKYYYLYIDLVSYQANINNKYEESLSYYISKSITHKKKNGYLQIDKVDNEYFVEMGYNYAKIETYVYSHQLRDAIIGMSRILSSITYNDDVIDSLIEKKETSSKTTEFNIYKPGVVENNYIENIIEDVTDVSGTVEDQDTIEIKLND